MATRNEQRPTCVLHLAKFPTTLKRDLKAIAALEGKPLNELIVSTLSARVRDARLKKGGVLSH